MTKVDWSQFKVRCSAINNVLSNKQGYAPLTPNQQEKMRELLDKQQKEKGLTERQAIELAELHFKHVKSKEIVLSDTCIEYLMQEYSYRTTGKVSVGKELGLDVTDKGKQVQSDSLKLLELVEGVTYTENKDRVVNDYLSGEPDAYSGLSLIDITGVKEIKSVWDYPGFLKRINCGLDIEHDQQIKGYGDILSCGNLSLSYCLVNTPEHIIFKTLERLLRSLDVISAESPEYIQKAAELERSMRFDDISPHQRVFTLKVEPFSSSEREKLYEKVKICREWLFKFDEQYQKINLN